MSKIAIYPGTFDPITFGHIDVIKKSLKLFDKIVVGVSDESNKNYLFSSEEIGLHEFGIRILRYPISLKAISRQINARSSDLIGRCSLIKHAIFPPHDQTCHTEGEVL